MTIRHCDTFIQYDGCSGGHFQISCTILISSPLVKCLSLDSDINGSLKFIDTVLVIVALQCRYRSVDLSNTSPETIIITVL